MRQSPEADLPVAKPAPPMNWAIDAACRGQNPGWWYPERRGNEYAHRAIIVCNRCPVKAECLDWALAADERHGIWGGMGEIERRRELTRRERLHGG